MKAKASTDSLWMTLRQGGFRRLLGGQLLSDLANWIDMLALSTLIVYTWGYGAWAVAALLLCTGLPWVVVGPPLSVRMGGRNGKRVLIACDLLRAVIMSALILASSLPVLLLLVFLKMSVSAVFDPVRQGAVKRFVNPEQLAQASSLSQLSVNLTKVCGPVFGGMLIGWLDERIVFAVCGLLYVVSALVLRGLSDWKLPDRPRTENGTNSGLRFAWRHIAAKPTLRQAVLFLTIAFFLLFLYDGLFAIFARETGLRESDLGLLLSSVGAGSVLGALWAGRFTAWRSRPVTRMVQVEIAAGLFVAFIGIGGYGWVVPPVWLWMLVFAALGFTGAQSAVPFGYVLQTETTDETIGPVSSLTNALQTGSMLVAPSLGAVIAELVGVGGVFLSVGLALSLFSALFWLLGIQRGAIRLKRSNA